MRECNTIKGMQSLSSVGSACGALLTGNTSLNWDSYDASSDHVLQEHCTVLKVEAVEVCALHQVTQGFRFKGCETRITYLPERTGNTFISFMETYEHVRVY